MDEAEPASAGLVPPKRDPAKVLEAGENVLHQLPPGIDCRVPRRRIDHVFLWRRVDGAAAAQQFLPQLGRDIATVKRGVGGGDIGQKSRCVAQIRVVSGLMMRRMIVPSPSTPAWILDERPPRPKHSASARLRADERCALHGVLSANASPSFGTTGRPASNTMLHQPRSLHRRK